MQYMAAEPIIRTKEVRDDGSVVEIVVWRVPQPVSPCTHLVQVPPVLRGRWALPGALRQRAGKGDHRHVDGVEEPYRFVSLAQLLDDFQRDVETWR